MATTHHSLYFFAVVTAYMYQQCNCADYTYLDDYVSWIDRQSPHTLNNLDVQLPSDVKNALFAYHFRLFIPNVEDSPQEMYRSIQSRAVSRDSVTIQFRISYHHALSSTLIIEFYPTTREIDACIDLQCKYQRLQLFSHSDASHNYITIHSGIITSLFDRKFQTNFKIALDNVFKEMYRKGYTVDNLIIGGHSMGGAHAQAFYFLLYGDYVHVPDAIKTLRSKIKWFNKDNEYRNGVMHKFERVIHRDNKGKITVLTTGAILILPSMDNYITDHQVGIIETGRIINLIKRKDPVPMAFGGNNKPQITNDGVDRNIQCSEASLKGLFVSVRKSFYKKTLGTATTVGRYYIIYKDVSGIAKTSRNVEKMTGGGKGYDDRCDIGVKMKLLIDGSWIGAKDVNHEYLTKHLKEGSVLLASKVFTLPFTERLSFLPRDFGNIHGGDLIFSARFMFNHNEYGNDIESYICNEPYYEADQTLLKHREIVLFYKLHQLQIRKKKDLYEGNKELKKWIKAQENRQSWKRLAGAK